MNEIDLLLERYEPPIKEIFIPDSNESTVESTESNITLNNKYPEYEIDISEYEFTTEIKIKVNGNKNKLEILKDGKNNEVIEKINRKLKILEELEKEYNEKLKNVNNAEYIYLEQKYKLQNKNEKDALISKYENQLKYKEEDTALLYENKIKILEEKIKNNSELEIYKVKLENSNEKITKLKEELNEVKEDKIQLYNLTNKSNQTKGREGEQEILDYLKSKLELDSESIIEYVGKDKKYSSDLELKYKNLNNCVIEIKNHKNEIYNNDIKKFEEVYIKQEKYNCGIFISLQSEYSSSTAKSDYTINIIDKKPIIYISNVEDNKKKIIYAIKILNNILKNQDIIKNTNEVLKLIKNTLNKMTNYKKEKNENYRKEINMINDMIEPIIYFLEQNNDNEMSEKINNDNLNIINDNSNNENDNQVLKNEIKLEKILEKINKGELYIDQKTKELKYPIKIKQFIKPIIDSNMELLCNICNKKSTLQYGVMYNHIIKEHKDKI